MNAPPYTDRYRKVMQLAQQEACRFNHRAVDAHHLALALVKEGGGLAVILLKNLDIDPSKVRLEIEKLVESEDEPVMRALLPLTKAAQAIVELAAREARETMGEEAHVGTEHLLLALSYLRETVAYQVLNSLGATHKKLHDELQNVLRNPKLSDPSEVKELLNQLQKAYGTESHTDALQHALQTYRTLALLQESLEALMQRIQPKR
ncbi:MAG: hypothetical protein HY006_03475 [Candidatus Sungbacteria bacterium]|nr:hypothetical protein [Candidatus Sungbacteria bacterium]